MTEQPNSPQHDPEPAVPPRDARDFGSAALPEAIPTAEPEEAVSPPPPPPPPPPQRGRGGSLLPWVYALGAVVLGWAVLFLWLHPIGRGQAPGEVQRVDALASQVQTLSGQVKQLAGRPAGQPDAIAALRQQVEALSARRPAATSIPDIGPLQEKVAQLSQEVAALASKPSPQGSGAETQAVAALSQRIGTLEQKLGSVEQRVGAADSVNQDVDQLKQRLEQLAKDQQVISDQVHTLRSGQADAQNGLSRRIDAQAADIADLRTAMKHVEATAGQADRIMRIEAAFAALDAGRPLGAIPGAPPAVARFADHPPPTLASLRQSFPAVAEAALAASQPSTDNKAFFDRVWSRAQQLVTVRQGDHVIVGDPAEGVIAHARAALDAGDLSGAVQALDGLSGAPAKAVAPWVEQAKELLAARNGLFALAEHVQ